MQRRKIPKTLSGIETSRERRKATRRLAGKYLKPYQGLKLRVAGDRARDISVAGKYLKPYQGLKHKPNRVRLGVVTPENT